MRAQLIVAPVMAGLAAASTCKARTSANVISASSVVSSDISAATGYGANTVISASTASASKVSFSTSSGYGANPIVSAASSSVKSISTAAKPSVVPSGGAASSGVATSTGYSGYGANPVVSPAASKTISSTGTAAAGATSSATQSGNAYGSNPVASKATSAIAVAASTTSAADDIGEVIVDAFLNLSTDIEEIIGEAAQTLGTIFYGVASKLERDCTEKDCWNDGYCSFVDYDLPSGIDGTASVAGDIWNLGANCGGCVEVKHEGQTYTLMVTNQASSAANATQLELTPATWDIMTTSDSTHVAAGLKWNWVQCPIQDEPLFVRVHAEATKSWFAVTIENAIERTAKLEISVDAGITWSDCTADEYNLHVFDGTLNCDSVYLRATSITGKTAVIENVAITAATVHKGTCNYV